MIRMLVVLLVVIMVCIVLFPFRDQPHAPTSPPSPLDLTELLGGEPGTGFARALSPRSFSFPADHGPHPEYRAEWWYYTGNLKTAQGRHLGFQLTFFRHALTAEPQQRTSAWGASQIYMAHLAISDVQGKRFCAFERFSRAALGLAGAAGHPFRVWLEDWSVAEDETETMHLYAREGEIGLDLTLRNTKPVVLHGQDGLSSKGPGNASYYYSLTRLATSGTVQLNGETYRVQGWSWMDREWSTSVLGKTIVGWDWFALQLNDGREIMFYQLRRRDGGAASVSGTLIQADGSTTALSHSDVELSILDHWKSSSETRYPSRWCMRIPLANLELEIIPQLADQELNLAVRYWEGAVQIRSRDTTVDGGHGYVELTGYGR